MLVKYQELQVAYYFSCDVDSIRETSKVVSTLQMPSVGAPVYAIYSYFRKLQTNYSHPVLPSPYWEFCNNFLKIFLFSYLVFISMICMMDVKLRYVVKLTSIFLILMQISHSMMSRIKIRSSKIYGDGILCPVSIEDVT